MLVGFSLMTMLVLMNYKPVYIVSLNGEDIGLVKSKSIVQKSLENYIKNGDGTSENFGYILMETMPEYTFELVKKDVSTSDEDVFAKLMDEAEVFYKIYGIEVDGEEVCITESMEMAQKIVDEVNADQEDYKNKSELKIVEKYSKEYEAITETDTVVASIMQPIIKANTVVKNKTYASASSATVSVSSEILDELLNTVGELNFKLPVEGATITSKYGWRKFGGVTEFHTGIDYAIAHGTPIYASEAGVVTCAQWSGNYGYLIKIQHISGYETRYAHCSRFNVSVGDTVEQGDLIGYVGNTGRSTGPHVHFEIRIKGEHIDPNDML